MRKGERYSRTVRGFSLVEMIVVLGMLAIISSMGAVAFSRVSTMWNDIRAQAELDQSLDDAFNTFQEDLADTLSAGLSGEAILGIRQNAQDERYFDRVLGDDVIVLPVQHTATGVRMRSGSKIAWRVDRESEVHRLVRTSGELNERIPEGPSVDIIGEAELVRLRFEYVSPNQPGKWLDEWNADTQPAAVRMSMVVADPRHPWVQVSRKAVFPVNVR